MIYGLWNIREIYKPYNLYGTRITVKLSFVKFPTVKYNIREIL